VSVLALVRHGQASFFADDYDRLSPVGEAQSRRLGAYWALRGEPFSEVYAGPRSRQLETAVLVGAEVRRAGLPWPRTIVLEELDLSGLLERLAPALAREDRDFDELVNTHRRGVGESERIRSFQRMFERLLTHWLTGPSVASVESWTAFRDRVGRGLDRITAGQGRGRRVAAFTSGGFIGAAAALALGAPDRTAIELSWRLRNGSLTHLMFTHGRLTLDDFNAIPHLPDPTEWTYR